MRQVSPFRSPPPRLARSSRAGERGARRRPRAGALAGVLGAFFLAGCGGGGDADGGPSALLITLDTTRADALSCYGGDPGVTPNLDRIAAEGVRFTRAYATVPLTLPSHLSMLTGLYPLRHGVRDNGHQVLAADVPTLAEAARAAGVQTAAFVSASVLHQDFGIGQGFSTFDAPADDLARRTTEFPSRRAHETVARALAWLGERDRSRGYLLWVHLWDPHLPHEAPPRFRRRTPYLSEVACADDAVGILVEGLRAEGVLDETTIVVVGDHGEAFGEHGETTHGAFCYDTTLHVPLLVRYPDGRDAGARDDRITSVADVEPTLAVALGLRASSGIDGRALQGEEDPGRGVYFESYYGYFAYGWSQLSGWIDGEGKYVHGTRPLFFDPRRDPGETDDLAPARGAALERYRAAIAAVAALPSHPPASGDAVSEELRAAIRATGYAGGDTGEEAIPGPLDPSPRPWPMSRVSELKDIDRAYRLLQGGRFAEAAAIYERIVADNGRNLWCRELLAHCYIQERRYPEAIVQLQAVVEGGRGVPETYGNLGACLAAVGRMDAALDCFLHVLERAPNRKPALLNATRLLEAKGRAEEAAPLRRRYRELFGEEIPRTP